MAEQRRPVRFFYYRIPNDGVLWLDENTHVMSAEYDKAHFEVVLVEYGPETDWEPNVAAEVNGDGT